MRQPHKNLFVFYRGATPKDQASFALLERQLEDNVTKALVYVLEHTDRERVLVPFLKELVGIDAHFDSDTVQFALQRVDIARPSIPRRIALTVAPTAQLSEGAVDAHETGRPDAWIWSDGTFAVLVEAKVRGSANRAQIRRHVEGAEGWKGSQVAWRPLSWSNIYEFVVRARQNPAHLDPVTRLLLSEFVEYLRMNGLATDTTFDLHDFGYFLLDPRDRDSSTRTLLAQKLARFSEEFIKAPSIQSVVRRYGGKAGSQEYVSPGVFRRESQNYWITIGPKDRRDRCHFTLRLEEDGISLEVFSPYRSFTKPLVEKIESNPTDFVAALAPMRNEDHYFFRLREAHYHDPHSSYKGQRIGKKVDFLHIDTRVLTPDNVLTLIVEPIKRRLKDSSLRPEIFLVRHFSLSELVGKSDVVARVAAAAQPMLPYLEYALALR
jgi:hypothetical protein